MSYKPKVYTASKLHYHKLWRTIRLDPDWAFVEFTASWPDNPDVWAEATNQELTTEALRTGWMKDITEVRESDFVLLYGRPGEALRGALVECGAALGLGLPVLAVGIEPADHTWTNHIKVRCFPNLTEARTHLMRYTTMIPPSRKRMLVND